MKVSSSERLLVCILSRPQAKMGTQICQWLKIIPLYPDRVISKLIHPILDNMFFIRKIFFEEPLHRGINENIISDDEALGDQWVLF